MAALNVHSRTGCVCPSRLTSRSVARPCSGTVHISCRCSDRAANAPATSTRQGLDRRALLNTGFLGVLGSLLPRSASAGKTPEVGTYLPPAGIDDLVEFVPNKTKTPSIRAGTIDASKPYKFDIPPSWQELQVANIQSGNFCQPRCDEPWTEVIFSNDKEGKLQLIVSPLNRLTRKANARLSDIGPPQGLIESFGNFITGTYLDPEDVISADKQDVDGREFYFYEVNASYGTNGPHTLSAVTTKGSLAYLFIVSANDKQWAKSESKLRKVVQTFRA